MDHQLVHRRPDMTPRHGHAVSVLVIVAYWAGFNHYLPLARACGPILLRIAGADLIGIDGAHCQLARWASNGMSFFFTGSGLNQLPIGVMGVRVM